MWNHFRLTLSRSSFLSPSALFLRVFLDQVDKYPCLYLNAEILQDAIRRYETVWPKVLALVPEPERPSLVAPIDVEWVWLCHMLCPVKYLADTIAIWNTANPGKPLAEGKHPAIDHALHNPTRREAGLRRARQLWQSVAPHEPFDVHEKLSTAPTLVSNPHSLPNPSNISYDIAQAASRQMAFHYQVCPMPQYGSLSFLRKGAIRYRKQYLYLLKKYPNEIWIPTYDIDLIWHAHMAHPRQYYHDTIRITGRLQPHDDTLNDRSEGSDLLARWRVTQQMWEQTFNSSIGRSGGMWRGNISAMELLLRPRIAHDVTRANKVLSRNGHKAHRVCDVKRQQSSEDSQPTPSIRETLYVPSFASENSIQQSDNNLAQPWVHLAVCCSAIENSQHKPEDVIERWAMLENTPVFCRVAHVLLRGSHQKVSDVSSIVEICCSQSGQQRTVDNIHLLPIASAHTPPLHSICQGRNNRDPSPKKEERALVLRLGGVDYAILTGQWKGFVCPKKGIRQGEPGGPRRGSFGASGHLNLQIWFIGNKEYGKGYWKKFKGNIVQKEKGLYTMDMPDSKKLQFHLQKGTIAGDSGISGYLIAMSAAALFAVLQPRFRPAGERIGTDETLYPAWSVQQEKFRMLNTAGGEIVQNGRRYGVGSMIALNRFSTSLFDFSGDVGSIGDPSGAFPGGCGGCGGCGCM